MSGARNLAEMSSRYCQKQERSDSRVSGGETYLLGEIFSAREIGDIRHVSSSGRIWTTIDHDVATAKSTTDKGRTGKNRESLNLRFAAVQRRLNLLCSPTLSFSVSLSLSLSRSLPMISPPFEGPGITSIIILFAVHHQPAVAIQEKLRCATTMHEWWCCI